MYDIIIVGGGPAGSTLARFVGRKYKVLLLEKRTFEIDKPVCHKCCGGLIAPDAQLMLARFGLGVPKSVIISPQMFSVRTIDMDNKLEKYYQRHYININREEFDKWLLSIVPADVEIIKGSIYKSFEVMDEVLDVKFIFQGKEYNEKTKLLVGTDGAFSGIRRQRFGNHPAPQLYVAIQEWYETKQDLNYYGVVFDSEITDFYSWTIPKEEHLILGSALKPDPDAYGKFELLKKKLGDYGFELNKCIRKEGAYLLRPVNVGQICPGDDYIALSGEAAGFISPSSAEGLSYAFKSSLALAKALENGIEGYHDKYLANIKVLKQNILLKNLKSPAMYNRFLRKAIMKTGLQSIDITGEI